MKERIEKLVKLMTANKKNKAITVCAGALTVAMVSTGVWYGVSAGEERTTPKSTKKEVVIEEKEITKKDVQEVVKGIEDHYILQDAKNIDYEYGITYEEEVVKDVKVDTSKVDLSTPGQYPVTYTVTVDTEAMLAHMETGSKATEEKAPEQSTVEPEEQENPAAEEKENTESIPEQTPETKPEEDADTTPDKEEPEETPEQTPNKPSEEKDETTDVEIDTEVDVVDKETAEDLAGKDEIVWGDNNESVPKEDGTLPEEVPEETPEQTPEETPSDNNENAQTGNSGSNSGNNSGSSKPSKPSGGSTGGSTGGNTASKPSKPAHTHSWVEQTKQVHHEASGHYETKVIQAAWDEPIYENRTICNYCGADITGNTDHCAWCGPNGEGSGYSIKPVQTGTKHHPAKTEQVWVQDSAAWTETVVTGYKCSCGATK